MTIISVHKKNLSLILLIFSLMFLAVTMPSQGQNISVKDGILKSKHFAPLSWYASKGFAAPANYKKTINVNFSGIPLVTALKKIAVKGHFRLSYSNKELSGYKVTLTRRNVMIISAFEDVLKGTGLKAVGSPDGQVVIKKGKNNNLLTLIKAPEHVVSGTVTDAQTGKSLPGVNILITGTSSGTTTNSKGGYSLSVPSMQDTLRFSFIGYQTKVVPIKGRRMINIELKTKLFSGQQLVVVGYGKQKKVNYTGAISQISGKSIHDIPVTNIGNSLSGRLIGVTTIQTTGQPGISKPEIYIRGISTFNNTSPLVVIDGIPSDLNTLEQLDISTVKSISVLKDASATAVYGVRGANGVIIITTKKGKGKLQISADFNGGFQVPQVLLKYASGPQLVKAVNEGYILDGQPNQTLPKEFIRNVFSGKYPAIYPNHQWWKKLTKNKAFQTRSDIHISGGTEHAQYFVSLGYLKKDGFLNTDIVGGPGKIFNFGSHRFNITSNVGLDLTKTTKIRIGVKSFLKSMREPSSIGIDPHRFWGFILGHTNPFATVGIVNNKFVKTNKRYFPFIVKTSMLSKVYGNGYRDISNKKMDLNIKFSQKLFKGFEFDIKGSYTSGFNRTQNFKKGINTYLPVFLNDVKNSNRIPGDSTVVLVPQSSEINIGKWNGNYTVDRSLYWQAAFRFRRSFGRNNVKSMLLYNESKNYYPNVAAFKNIPTGYVGSAFRAAYNFDEKYLLEFDAAYNGSENFVRGRRFGFFPAMSAGWVISKENFMKNIPFISYLKIKFSFGKVGSDRIGGSRFLYLPSTYDRTNKKFSGYNFGLNIPDQLLGTTVGAIGNPNVSWETAIKRNIGIVTHFFNNRLKLKFNYFIQLRKNILMRHHTLPVFITAPAPLPPFNFGRVRNHGYEMKLGWNDNIGGLSYGITANWSFAKNKILYMDEVHRVEPYLRRTGRPLSTHFGYIIKGFYNKNNINSPNIPKIEFGPATPRPGDLIYKDLNGDGIIDFRDQKPIGYPRIPQVTFAVLMRLNYKGFGIRMNWQGVTQVSRNLTGVFKEPRLNQGMGVLEWYLNKTWTPERSKKGIGGLLPRLSSNGSGNANYVGSTMWLRNASFLRLKNVELSYMFKNQFLQKAGIGGLRVYLSGYNLLTFKHQGFKTLNPEKNFGNDDNHYPTMKIFNFGFHIKF